MINHSNQDESKMILSHMRLQSTSATLPLMSPEHHRSSLPMDERPGSQILALARLLFLSFISSGQCESVRGRAAVALVVELDRVLDLPEDVNLCIRV